jgi:tripartite-type tricarboxylate transporter receptor subunit TctC
MSITRRLALQSAAAGLVLGPARAQDTRVTRFVVGLAAGGATDIAGRLIANALMERYGQRVIVDNRPGAGSLIAAEVVARSPADGLTYFMPTGSFATSAAITPTLTFDPFGFMPVLQLTRVPFCIAVNSSVAATSIPELIALARRERGGLHYASTGVAGQAHFAGELFNALTGAGLIHVPYRGAAPALTDVIAGLVPIMFTDLFSVLPRARRGEVRILGVTTPERATAAPEIPTVREQGVAELTISGWSGFLAPAGTDAATVELLNRRVGEIASDAEFRRRMGADGAELIVSRPSEFGRFLREEIETYRRIAASAGIQPG